jgi:predicted Holliday junction resolvase-like endonuclease
MKQNLHENDDTYLVIFGAVILLLLIVIAQFIYISRMRAKHRESEEKAKNLEKQINEEQTMREKIQSSSPKLDCSQPSIQHLETVNNISLESFFEDKLSSRSQHNFSKSGDNPSKFLLQF